MAQVVVVNRIGSRRDFAGDAFERTPLLLDAVCLLHLRSGALGANRFGINAKLYIGHHGLAEQGIETKEQLTAHGLKLLLPGDIQDGDDQSFPVKPKRHGLRA